ncbi:MULTISPECIES: hypothetical protein [unclassified Microbacterium]|uniref:hypothetical protein n=1 Tax=unclassified Microbacterium TaxID=2609290 RepID=UPI0016051D58|nr:MULTISPECIES: hypothetical protein [unclassified Microbacterium]QNA92487.1 hypothetical protein G4G29_09100 [Microbacterium sp. Se63.02b]QYM65782.1 hypothetical protein K1X59_09140 [Microbacterium sp. Se5.02b]
MTSDSDDALNWEGDETPTPKDPALPHGWNAVGKGSEDVGTIEDDGTVTPVGSDEPAGLSTPMLLILGVVGGVYLLYTIGWIVGGLRLKPLASFLVTDAMFLPWFVLAIAAPALWFLASWVLTRARPAWIRVAVLLAGVVLLVPWPFVTVGVIGS